MGDGWIRTAETDTRKHILKHTYKFKYIELKDWTDADDDDEIGQREVVVSGIKCWDREDGRWRK